ncbi:thioredoxin domain-containing protein [Erythrobacter sp. 3-20A1M]|uniref:DsbA family protein n=1 Tax=Erythrobacter sp. 3-20A1M TaxID=2653850 RepID=UPI001BFC9B27|nr:DsbA family protein [Erythrobacter sp. 3-20A1M]QWC56741.1 thioredoxin domain-containing protein [Erythrobacter sp. 3-20A1M]
MKRSLLIAVLGLSALAAGFLGAWLFSLSGLADRRTESYLVEHPQILERMVAELQRRQAEGRLSGVEADVTHAFPGAVLGNPQGSKTLVEFSDYHCGYCRLSSREVEALIRSDPQVRVVVREWPIFDGSEELARLALAAAKQGKFAAFHRALFDHQGDADAIAKAAQAAGLDLARARKDAVGADITAEIERNGELAQRLAFSGTPSWVANGTILEGAQGQEALAKALVPDRE